MLVVLTSPNRIESYHKGEPYQEINYQSFASQDFHSWAAHDRLAQGEFSLEFFDTYFNSAINISRQPINVRALARMCLDYSTVIGANLFNFSIKFFILK